MHLSFVQVLAEVLVLEAEEAVSYGLIDAVGGLSEALERLKEMVSKKNEKENENNSHSKKDRKKA